MANRYHTNMRQIDIGSASTLVCIDGPSNKLKNDTGTKSKGMNEQQIARCNNIEGWLREDIGNHIGNPILSEPPMTKDVYVKYGRLNRILSPIQFTHPAAIGGVKMSYEMHQPRVVWG